MRKDSIWLAVLSIALLLVSGVIAHGQAEVQSEPPLPGMADDDNDEAETVNIEVDGFDDMLSVEIIFGEDDIEGFIRIDSVDEDEINFDDVPEGIAEAFRESLVSAGLIEAERPVTVLLGEAEGYGGTLTVEVATEITAVEVVEHSETEDLAEPALEQIPQDIVEQQNLQVDVATGATDTSEAIIEAVRYALSDPEADVTEEGMILRGEGEGYGGPVIVDITVAIDDVSVVQHSETEGLVEPALEEVTQAIVQTQSWDVDIYSGATVTSEAIMEAVRNALTGE